MSQGELSKVDDLAQKVNLLEVEIGGSNDELTKKIDALANEIGGTRNIFY